MFAERVFWPASVFLLALMLISQAVSILQESQTYDEAVHLAAGYSYLTTGDYRLNPEHPPLSKMLAALPLLFLKPHLPVEDASWSNGNTLYFGATFLYLNRVPAETLLLVARSVTILCTVSFGLFLAVWTRRRFGAAVALLALFLYALDPNIIAHGRYVTSDLPITCFLFLAVIAWAAFLSSRRWRDLATAGLGLGLASVVKFSGLALFPIFVVLYVIKWWQESRPDSGAASRRKLSASHLALSLAVIGGITVVLIAACYGPETIRLTRRGSPSAPLAARMDRQDWFGERLYQTASFLNIPSYSYLLGLRVVARHNSEGHPAYLLGKTSEKGGWWYYFPVAFALKTPTAVLLLLLVSLLIVVAGLRHGNLFHILKRLPFHWYVLALPMTAFFLLGMRSHLTIGLRHILPVYPFLFVLVSAIVLGSPSRKVLPVLLVAVALLQIAENVRIFPHYLAFFNLPSGGPAHGTDYLLDSNIDWGQDLKKFRRWLDTHGNPPVCLAYFGMSYTTLYGMRQNSLPATWEVEKRSHLDCIGAISATLLHDVYVQPGQFAWLRQLKPIGNIGYSLYLYDLRKPRAH
jgi:Dolichyl-phosphate-mannose-protein mannosyltransferase